KGDWTIWAGKYPGGVYVNKGRYIEFDRNQMYTLAELESGKGVKILDKDYQAITTSSMEMFERAFANEFSYRDNFTFLREFILVKRIKHPMMARRLTAVLHSIPARCNEDYQLLPYNEIAILFHDTMPDNDYTCGIYIPYQQALKELNKKHLIEFFEGMPYRILGANCIMLVQYIVNTITVG
ncbi:6328_t:CDS:2, partial [Gigaspora rosea]